MIQFWQLRIINLSFKDTIFKLSSDIETRERNDEYLIHQQYREFTIRTFFRNAFLHSLFVFWNLYPKKNSNDPCENLFHALALYRRLPQRKSGVSKYRIVVYRLFNTLKFKRPFDNRSLRSVAGMRRRLPLKISSFWYTRMAECIRESQSNRMYIQENG